MFTMFCEINPKKIESLVRCQFTIFDCQFLHKSESVVLNWSKNREWKKCISIHHLMKILDADAETLLFTFIALLLSRDDIWGWMRQTWCLCGPQSKQEKCDHMFIKSAKRKESCKITINSFNIHDFCGRNYLCVCVCGPSGTFEKE